MEHIDIAFPEDEYFDNEPQPYEEEQESSKETETSQEIVDQFRAEAPKRVAAYAEQIKENQQHFVEKYEKRAAAGKELSDFTIKCAEDDIRYLWNYINAEVLNSDLVRDEEKQAAAESEIFFLHGEEELHKTIEAQSGRFFQSRANDLREAIEDSDKSEKEKAGDIKRIEAFYELAQSHLQYKYDEEEYSDQDAETWNMYEAARTRTHNATIDALNSLNALANKYGTKPFTPRDFWSTGHHDASKLAVGKRCRYDRDVVEEYYSVAFASEAKKAKEDFMDRHLELQTTEEARDRFMRDVWRAVADLQSRGVEANPEEAA